MRCPNRLSVVLLAACSHSSPREASRPHEHQHQHEHEAHGHEHHGHGGHRFEKADDWAKVFDDPARDAWQKPDAVVAALALAPGMTVADVGAGTGYFERRLSVGVGPAGKVFAVDIEPDMIRYLGERAKRESTPNVTPVLGTPDSPSLEAGALDRILVVDTWHHVPSRADYAKKLAAALKPGGFVLVVDFTVQSDKGPPPAMRLTPDAVRGDLETAGLSTTLVDVGLPDQYVVQGTRK